MTIKNAINLFKRLVSETTNKSEIKVYKDFIEILTHVEKRNLTASEVESLETELDALELNSIRTVNWKICASKSATFHIRNRVCPI